MEGSSAASPLIEPIIPVITACAPALSGENIGLRKYDDVPNVLLIPCVMLFPIKLFAAMESVNSAQNQDFSNGTLFVEINSPMLVQYTGKETIVLSRGTHTSGFYVRKNFTSVHVP